MQVKNTNSRSSLFICCFTLRKLNQSFCFTLGSPRYSLILKLFFSNFQLFFLGYDAGLEYCWNYCLLYFFILILFARFLSKSDDDSKLFFNVCTYFIYCHFTILQNYHLASSPSSCHQVELSKLP